MPHPLHVIFCGTSAFAVPSLQALTADAAFVVDLVVAQPDRPTGRKQILTPPPVKTAALEAGLPVFQPEHLNRALVAELATRGIARPDFLVTASYGQLLSDEILALPTVAPVNVHASLLPRWRGASPIQSAILAGDRETGVSIPRMVRKLDAGPILGRDTLTLGGTETAQDLHDRLAMMGAELLVRTLKQPLHEEPQRETDATTCRKLRRQDGLVDPDAMTAAEIDRRVRALNPWPGVICRIDDQEIKILKGSLSSDPDATPLSCAEDTILYLVEVQPLSKKPMSGKAWMAGRQRKR